MDASVNLLLQLGGAIACIGVALVAARDGLRWRRRRQRRLAERVASREAFRERVAAAAERSRLRDQSRRAWEGVRPLRVAAVVDECRDVKSFYLADPEGRSLPPFLPGQHLTVHLPVAPGAPPVVRCYSLSDRPREESYRITVKRNPPPSDTPDAPPGVGSNWLHDRVRAGDTISCGPPSGDFHLAPPLAAPVVLIGGGIGVTPVLSIALTLLHRGVDRDVHLLLGVRNRDEFPFREAVEELRGSSPRLTVRVACSRPLDDEAPGRDYQHRGHVTIDYLRTALPSNNFRYYLCGPPKMMQSLAPGLLEWGVPDDHIHFEAFGPASVPRQDAETLAAEAIGMSVRFAQRGAEAVWSEGCQTLLELAERAGVPLESGCRVGNCGRCATPVVEGGVRTIRPPGAPTPAGQCLACISVPTSPLVLDA